MTKPKSIIPEFMTKNKDDTFMFLMPFRLKIDYENYGNSLFKVAVKNITKKRILIFLYIFKKNLNNCSTICMNGALF